jgi:adenylyltransferase/sulfurtransferase
MRTERYLRQILFHPIGKEGQRRLAEASAVVVGCGAIGSTTASLLARSGIGYLRVIDRDVLEESNLQRQELFDEEDLREGLPKALAAEKRLRRINSTIHVEGITADLNPTNAETLLRDAQVILDGTDNFETRLLLNDYALKTRTPWIYSACLGSQALLMNVLPGKTLCLRCLVDSVPLPGSLPTCETAGILAPAAKLIASIQTTEALKILTNHQEALISGLVNIDLWKGSFQKVDTQTAPSPTCPACQKGEYEFLNAKSFSLTTTLCGSNAVQITPGGNAGNGTKIDLHALSLRLQSTLGVDNISQSPYLLKFRCRDRALALSKTDRPEGLSLRLEMVIFPDGRAMLFGTQDTSLARTLYSQYVGL